MSDYMNMTEEHANKLRALYSEHVKHPGGHWKGPCIAIVPEALSAEVQDAMNFMGSTVFGILDAIGPNGKKIPAHWVGEGPNGEKVTYEIPPGSVGILSAGYWANGF